LAVSADELTAIVFPLGSLYDADSKTVSVTMEVERGAFAVAAADARAAGITVSATATGLTLSGDIQKISQFLSQPDNVFFVPGKTGIKGPLVFTVSDGLNTSVKRLDLVVEQPSAMKASYNGGTFEIFAGPTNNGIRLARSELSELRLGTLADELTVARLGDSPLIVRATEGADRIIMDMSNTTSEDGLPRILSLLDLDPESLVLNDGVWEGSQLANDSLTLRLKQAERTTNKNEVAIGRIDSPGNLVDRIRLINGVEEVLWDETLGRLTITGNSIRLVNLPDQEIADLGKNTEVVINADRLSIETPIRAKSVTLNVTERLSLQGSIFTWVSAGANAGTFVEDLSEVERLQEDGVQIVMAAPPMVAGQPVDLVAAFE